MGALALLAALLEPKEVKVEADLCLNRRHKDAACRLCADACPADAISLGGTASPKGSPPAQDAATLEQAHGAPAVDQDACLHCGICQAACPTGAFDVPEVNLGSLLTKASGKGSMTIACEKTSSHGTTRLACLAALNWEELAVLALAGNRQVRLLDGGCDGCSYNSHGIHDRIRAQAAAANAFLSSLEPTAGASGAPAVLLVEDDPDTLLPQGSAPAGSAGDTGRSDQSVSRRELFTRWRRQGTAVLADSLPDLNWLDAPPPPGLPHKLPASRQRLLNLLSRHGSTGASGNGAGGDGAGNPPLPLTQREVGPACDGCGLCATLCPTEALRLEVDGDAHRLTFQAAACVDCGLCDRICPQGAIERTPLSTLEPLLAGTRETLWQASPNTCRRCGQTHTGRQEICDRCAKSQDLLDDVRRLLFSV